jgi:alginate O-acetyltransferase complex protein AlgI
MLFSSATFLVFFAVYFACHLAVPPRFRLVLIIVGSTVFYAWWKVEYVFLPYVLAAIAYLGVWWMDLAATPAARARRATLATVLLFVPLATFKYTNFIVAEAVGPLFGWHRAVLDLDLPLGISFVTFTLTAFVIDRFNERFPPVPNFRTLLGHVLFFPHLIAGPILRPIELIPQLLQPRPAWAIRPAAAITIFTVGLVKKVVFADGISETINAAYASGAPTAPTALLAIYGFAMQIYCDFSGYTDMAIGIAMLLGVRLPRNFRQPYAARSLVDFWRRWHITLSNFIRDYLFVPLASSRAGMLRYVPRGRARAMAAILLSMGLCGLWHGAHWTFVLWGLLHGVGLSAIHVLRISASPFVSLIPAWIGWLLTFNFVTFSFVIFRAPDLSAAVRMSSAAVVGGGWTDWPQFAAASAFPLSLMMVAYGLHAFDDHRRLKLAVRRLPAAILWPSVLFAWIMAITLSQGGSSAKFIYFDF